MPKEKSQPKTSQKSAENESSSKGGITKAIAAVKGALKKDGNVIKAAKTSDGGWEVEIEVIEQSEHMKRIGIPKPVYDKNVYRVILDQNFEVVSYERKAQRPSGGLAE